MYLELFLEEPFINMEKLLEPTHLLIPSCNYTAKFCGEQIATKLDETNYCDSCSSVSLFSIGVGLAQEMQTLQRQMECLL